MAQLDLNKMGAGYSYKIVAEHRGSSLGLDYPYIFDRWDNIWFIWERATGNVIEAYDGPEWDRTIEKRCYELNGLNWRSTGGIDYDGLS